MSETLEQLDKAVQIDRRNGEKGRRNDGERRSDEVAVAEDRRQGQRRKAPRRRQIDPTTCERDYSNEEIDFMKALDEYKRNNGRMFPTCSEILEVVRSLGYVRLDTMQTDDESSNAPAAEVDLDAELSKIHNELAKIDVEPVA